MKLAFLLLVSVVLINGLAEAADFWPTDIHSTYLYLNDEGQVLEVEYGSFGTRVSRYIGTYTYRVTDQFNEDAEGDVFLSYTEGYLEGAIDPDYWRDFGTDFKFIDLPLVVGNSWTTVVQTSCCYSPCMSAFVFEVLSETEVTVPAGTFSVTELSVANVYGCPPYPQSGTYALNQEVGPVILPGGYKLVSIDGTVGVDHSTWGTLKALYR